MKQPSYSEPVINKVARNILIILMCLPFSLLIACETEDSQDMCNYQKHDMQFKYNNNWHISEESGWFTSPYVFLENEDSGLIMLMQLPKNEFAELKDFAQNYSQQTRSSLIMGSFSEGIFSELTSTLGIKGLQEKSEMTFMETTIEYIRHYYMFTNKSHDVFVILQSTNDELSENLPVLQQVLQSFTFIE